MGKPTLILDAYGKGVPVLGPGANVTLTAGGSSVSAALPADAYIVRVASINDCYIAFGTAGVTASGASMLFPKGSELFKVPVGVTHMAVIQHTTGGAVTITSLE